MSEHLLMQVPSAVNPLVTRGVSTRTAQNGSRLSPSSVPPVSDRNGTPSNGLAVHPDTLGRKSRMHADDRHRQLLRVAIEVFARNGFSGTKTKDIAAAAGISEAIVFRHFATKEDLYHAILDMKGENDCTVRNRASLQEFMDRRDDAGLFGHFARRIFQSFGEDPAFHRLMMYASLEGHLLANLFRERFVQPTGNLITKYIAQRQKEGVFRQGDPKVATMFAVGTIVHFAMSRHIFQLKRPVGGDDPVLEELVSMVLNGLTKKEAVLGNSSKAAVAGKAKLRRANSAAKVIAKHPGKGLHAQS